jgi:hypothetical protein
VVERKTLLLRLDPAVHDALARWAADELRSTNAQIEYLLRRALAEAARLPAGTGRLPRRGRPPKLPEGPAMDSEGPPGTVTRRGYCLAQDVAQERTHRSHDAHHRRCRSHTGERGSTCIS